MIWVVSTDVVRPASYTALRHNPAVGSKTGKRGSGSTGAGRDSEFSSSAREAVRNRSGEFVYLRASQFGRVIVVQLSQPPICMMNYTLPPYSNQGEAANLGQGQPKMQTSIAAGLLLVTLVALVFIGSICASCRQTRLSHLMNEHAEKEDASNRKKHIQSDLRVRPWKAERAVTGDTDDTFAKTKNGSAEKEITADSLHSVSLDDLESQSVPLCAICLAEFVEGDPVTDGTKCQHHFHEACLVDWLMKSSMCPICRNVYLPATV